MSIRVVPEQVVNFAGHRPFAYVISTVISTRDDPKNAQSVHVIAVEVDINQAIVDCSRVGGSTRRNIAVNSNVTIVWPPVLGSRDYDDYTLIADGQAVVRDEFVIVTVNSAILHRPAGP